MTEITTRLLVALTAVGFAGRAFADEPASSRPIIRLETNEAAGELHVMIDGKEAIVYQYGPKNDLPHYLVHYAWPFIRMNRKFHVQDGGGTITSSEGGVNQQETNGKPFTLKKGETLQQRVGVLVHRVDVQTGKLAARYEKYVAGEL